MSSSRRVIFHLDCFQAFDLFDILSVTFTFQNDLTWRDLYDSKFSLF